MQLLVEAEEQTAAGQTVPSTFALQCRAHADRVFELLDKTRDLNETSVLVLDNGTGYLPRRLAQGDTDVVAVELTEKLKKHAVALNSYPSIIYKKTNPFLLTQEFDLILDSGILCHFHPEIINYFLPRLACYSRRKMILGFSLERPWYLRFFSGSLKRDSEFKNPHESRFNENEITKLIETSCDMLLTERNLSGSSLLIKALRKPHSRRQDHSDPR
ncbi:hypothetical protein ACFL5K_05320 [Gemmatimonadota bacterium]